MRWKKNAVSYLTWIVYAVAAEVGLVCLSDALCDTMKIRISVGAISSLVYMLLAGLGVFLLHRLSGRRDGQWKWQTTAGILRAAIAVFLLAAGLILRIQHIGNATENAAYFELASVSQGQEVPQFAHGAVYFYVRLLNGLFFFLGNKFVVAIWTQILLQFIALLLLFFAVRRLAGENAAIVMLAFWTFSPYMIQGAVDLSPEMLYLVLWGGVLLWISCLAGRKKHICYFLTGLAVAFVVYLDIAGCFLLLVLAAAVFAFSESEEKIPGGVKLLRLLAVALGVAGGFASCVLVDALVTGKRFTDVLTVWFALYQPHTFTLPFSLTASTGGLTEYLVLMVVLMPGIFAYWRNRKTDGLMWWVILAVMVGLAGCVGLFTAEMPVGRFLYFSLTLLAGVSVNEALLPLKAKRSDSIEPKQGEMGEVGRETEKRENPAEHRSEAEKKEPSAVQQLPDEERGKQKAVTFIENPLPLPKKHVKRTMTFRLDEESGKDDFDIAVDESDDFDF